MTEVSALGNWNRRTEPRQGICLHYDGSASDPGAVTWLMRDPACKVSYNKLVLDDGRIVTITPEDARAWHAGVCRPASEQLRYRDANSALYGYAIAAKPGDTASVAQRDALVRLCVETFEREGWSRQETWRITEHALEAWPRGRKVDLGTHIKHLTLADVRVRVSSWL